MNRFCILSIVGLFFIVTGCSSSEPTVASRDVTVEEAAQLIKDNADLVILDIRTPEEFSKGHIEGAEMVNFMGDDFDEKIAALEKDKVYLMHCASGGRSGKAMAKFNAAGFTSIMHLKPGFMGWEKAGMPVSK